MKIDEKKSATWTYKLMFVRDDGNGTTVIVEIEVALACIGECVVSAKIYSRR
jgi:hypothetical protein